MPLSSMPWHEICDQSDIIGERLFVAVGEGPGTFFSLSWFPVAGGWGGPFWVAEIALMVERVGKFLFVQKQNLWPLSPVGESFDCGDHEKPDVSARHRFREELCRSCEGDDSYVDIVQFFASTCMYSRLLHKIFWSRCLML